MKKIFTVLASVILLLSANILFAQRVVNVTANVPDALFTAVAGAQAGDILTLTSGGIYPNSSALAPTVALTIRTATGFTRKATCVLMANATGGYNSSGNFLNMGGSITIENVIVDMNEGTVRAWGGTFLSRGTTTSTSTIRLDGVEVYKAGHLAEGGDLDSIIVRNSFFAGSFKTAGGWGATFDFQGDKVNYAEFTNNTFMFTIFGPFLGNGWGNWMSKDLGKVIIDHNTIYNVDGAHGPIVMFSRTKNVVITNNLFINPGFRPKEDYFSDKYLDFPQNEDALGTNAGVIRALGPKGTWVISLEMVDSANTDLTMEANNINFTTEVVNKWTSNGQTQPWLYTNETKSKIKDVAKATFSEELQFVNAPKTPMYMINMISDTTKAFNADTAKYKGKTPYRGFLCYDSAKANLNKPLYDFRVKDSVNMAYSNTTRKSYYGSVQAAGKGGIGYSLGDLNWYPTQKANWEKNINNPAYSVKQQDGVPGSFELSQNYPNPFNPTTNIDFSIQQTGLVTLKVFNILGQEVATLINQNMSPGKYTVDFDASKLSSGLFIYQLTSGTSTSIKKMMLLK